MRHMTSNPPWWLTLPPAEVAVTILPLFSHVPSKKETRAIEEIVEWCRTGSYPKPASFSRSSGSQQFTDPDKRSIAEAIQVLEHAGLLMLTVDGNPGEVSVGLTRLGMHALSTNAVRPHLGLSDDADHRER